MMYLEILFRCSYHLVSLCIFVCDTYTNNIVYCNDHHSDSQIVPHRRKVMNGLEVTGQYLFISRPLVVPLGFVK